MDEITTRLENLAQLDADELAQLAADIRAAYEQARNDGPAEGETGEAYFATLTALKDGLAAVNARQGELAAEEAEARRLLDELDTEVATLTGELSDDDAAVLAELSDEDRQALAALDDDARQALAELAAGDTPPAEGEQDTEAEVVELPTEQAETEAEPAEPDEDRVARAAAALRRVAPRRQPEPAEEQKPNRRVASSYDDDKPMTAEQVHKALGRAISSYGRIPNRHVRVASLHLTDEIATFDEVKDDFDGWFRGEVDRLRAHRQAAASGTRQASGALCAPELTLFDVIALGTADEPIGSVFPSLGASEADSMKNLKFVPALTFDEFEDAAGRTWGDDNPASESRSTLGIGSATMTENGASGTASPYPKARLKVTCPTTVTCEQRAVWVETGWDRALAAAWPELVDAVNAASRVAVAKEKEELRLEDWFAAADAANLVLAPQTTGQSFGGNHSFLQHVLTIVEHDRVAKMDHGAGYVVAVPTWLEPSLAPETLAMLDIASGNMSVEQARAEILRRYNVTLVSYRSAFGKSADARTTSNGFSTVLPNLAASSLVPQFPCEARIGIARDDAGFVRQGMDLNLGVVVTDDDLENNEFTVFSEGWDRLCFRIPPIVADVRVNPSAHTSGSVAAVVDNCGGSGS